MMLQEIQTFLVSTIIPKLHQTNSLLCKKTDASSSTSINDEITDEKNTSEEVSSHQNSAEVIYHTCDYNEINLLYIQKEACITSIYSINATNDISMNNDNNFIHKYYAPFLLSNNHEDISSGSEYNSEKQIVCRQTT